MKASLPRTLAVLLAVSVSLCGALAAHAPHDVVKVVGVSPQYDQDGILFASVTLSSHVLFARSTDGGRTWQEYGHPMVLRDISDFAFSPSFDRDGVAFAATRKGGIWRTSNRGSSWTQVYDTADGLAVEDVALPATGLWDGTVLAATELGVLRTTDRGETWSVAQGLTESQATAVTFGNGAGVAYAGHEVLHRSQDGGASWLPLTDLGRSMVDLEASPSARGSDTLATAFGHAFGGVWISTDGGVTFAPSNDGLADPSVNDVAFTSTGELFAVTRWQGCFRSAGPFSPWTLDMDGFDPKTYQTDDHYRSVGVSPAYASDSTVIVGSFEGLYISEDSGDNWEQQDIYSVRFLRQVVFSPDFTNDRTLFVGSYGGGIMKTRLEPGKTPEWIHYGTGLSGLYAGALALSPSYAEDQTVFYGYTSVYRSEDGGETWADLPQPVFNYIASRAFAISPDFKNDRRMYLGASPGSYRSEDAGDHWIPMTAGLPGTVRSTGMELSPDFLDDGIIFHISHEHGIHRSNDHGLTWTSLGLDIGEVRALALSPEFPSDRTVFVGVNWLGLYRSRNGGDTWEQIGDFLGDGPRIVEGIAISPDYANDRTVFVAMESGEVFKSTDGGDSWTWSGLGLPAQTTRAIAISPEYARDRTVIVTNHDWIWISTDGGERWRRLPGFIRVDDGDQMVRYGGTWGGSGTLGGWSGGQDYGVGTLQSNAAGATSELLFYGDGITWYAPMGPGSTGVARVSLDGRPVADVTLFSNQQKHQQEAFSWHFPKPGWHTIRVTNTGDFAPGSNPQPWPGPVVRSDGFGVDF